MCYIALCLLFLTQSVYANTEKVIFIGPSSLQVPIEHPTLEDLRLEALSPQQRSLRTHIQAEFPTNSSKYGKSSWYLLHELEEGRRYEVRVCWAATQPTSFWLKTYDLPTLFATPLLITSLAQDSESRQPDPSKLEDGNLGTTKRFKYTSDKLSSTLFLQIFAAADYYTTNKTLMNNVPPVFVDVILDPFILNVFPQSLIPTAAYIIILAVGAWYLSKYISRWIMNVALEDMNNDKKDR